MLYVYLKHFSDIFSTFHEIKHCENIAMIDVTHLIPNQLELTDWGKQCSAIMDLSEIEQTDVNNVASILRDPEVVGK